MLGGGKEKVGAKVRQGGKGAWDPAEKGGKY